MNKYTEQKIYRKALEKWGLKAQCEVAIEECGGLFLTFQELGYCDVGIENMFEVLEEYKQLSQ